VWGRIFSLVKKEFIQFRRDRLTLAIIFVMPPLQLFLLAYAMTVDVKHIRSLVLDEARDQYSRQFVASFVNTGYFDVVGYAESQEELRHGLESGVAKVGFVIPPNFTRELWAGRTSLAQILIDGSDPTVAQSALFASASIGQAAGMKLWEQTTGRGLERPQIQPVELRPLVLYNPSMKSSDFMVPGLIGMILQMQAMLLTAFAITRERERGTLEQLIATPLRPWEMIVGKVAPYVLVALWNVAVIMAVGLLWFHTRFAGSLLLFFVLSFVFLVGSLGVGMLVSTVAQNQTQALQMTFFYMLPAMVLSGFMFPRESMPPFLFYLGYGIPLTYFLRILRGIALKGIGLEYLWPEVLWLGVFGAVAFLISAMRLRRRLG